jgi:hypothetical protein
MCSGDDALVCIAPAKEVSDVNAGLNRNRPALMGILLAQKKVVSNVHFFLFRSSHP